jgi:membrane-bound metal-dependent hydrolase YbcI (DUF457 family)
MIFFGHLGITTEAFKLYKNVFHKGKAKENNMLPIDYRVVLIGSILPDLIDKPIGAFLFRSTFHNSRIFAHTLLFAAVLLAIGGILLYKRKNNKVTLLGIFCLIHLVLDSMWLYPRIVFWPFIGDKVASIGQTGWFKALISSRAFPARPEGNWVAEDIQHLLSDPFYLGAEIAGFIIIAFYFIRLIYRKELMAFIKHGKL